MSNLLVTGARIWDGAPLEGADAVLIERGRVAATGRAEALRARSPGVPELDAKGGTVTPGLCDAHLHLAPWARSLAQLDLRGSRTRAEALERVRQAAGRGEGPLVGRGWDESVWEAPPELACLDEASQGRAVVLHRHDFHALWVSSAALRAAGITRATPDPVGGRFERGPSGEPNGLVRENAVAAFQALEEAAGPSVDTALADRAASALHARGITWVHDFQRSASELRWSQALAGRGGLRVLQHVGLDQLDGLIAAGLSSGTGDAWFRLGALKLFADGTLGSRTAAMLAPFEDTGGLGWTPQAADELAHRVRRAIEAGVSVAIHAIGDRAVRDALDAIASAPRAAREALAMPPRIEHAQLVDEMDLGRFAPLGVLSSMQPQHCVTDAEVAALAWGARSARAYAWSAFLDRGVALAFGSDAPVEPPEPWLGLHAAITRRRPEGTPAGGFGVSRCLTLDEALAAYTSGAAHASGCRGMLGTLAPGAEGDLVVWNRDLHRLSPDEVLTARPLHTVLAGGIVYQSAGNPTPTGSHRPPGTAS